MGQKPFIHLAVRTSFSLLESMITTKGLTTWCKDQGMPAVAVTDRNNLFGALELSESLSGAGIQPIMAVGFDVTDGAHVAHASRTIGWIATAYTHRAAHPPSALRVVEDLQRHVLVGARAQP